MKKKRQNSERSWRKAQNTRQIQLIPKRFGSGVAYGDAGEVMLAVTADKFYINKPWSAIFGEAAFHFLLFFIISMISFHILLVPAVPLWVIEGYRFFYVFFKKLERFNISKIKFAVFGAAVILTELVAAHFLRELIYYVYKVIFWHI